MNNNTYKRMVKRVHDINLGPLSKPIIVKKLTEIQNNYNTLLGEYTNGEEPSYEIVAETKGIFSAFKESEKWQEIGTLSMHDWKCNINDNIAIDTNCVVERKDTGELFEVIFKREYIGEYEIGLRPVNN